MAHEVAVGIDLGTEFSVVSVLRKGKVEVLCNDDGYRKTPSVVAFWGDERYVGSAALDLDWSRVFDVKRLIGRRWGDINIQCMRKFSSFDVVEQNGTLRIQVLVSPGKRETFAPEEISAMVIRNLKETAELALEQTVTKAVITVPAYFNDRQRQATKNAGKIAGLDVLGIISEPTAVAIAYGLNNVSTSKRTAVIFDLGGDTFDVSVMAINGSEFRILASDGDTHLGRRDFELRLLSYFLQDIRKRHRLDLEVMKDSVSIHELSNNCKLLRRKLCSLPQATVSLFLSKHSLPYRNQITRELFENLCMDLFKKVRATTVKVLMSSGVAPRAVDDVVLVGVATRIPKVRALLSALFGAEKLRYSLEADQVVSRGAAMHADALTRALGPRM